MKTNTPVSTRKVTFTVKVKASYLVVKSIAGDVSKTLRMVSSLINTMAKSYTGAKWFSALDEILGHECVICGSVKDEAVVLSPCCKRWVHNSCHNEESQGNRSEMMEMLRRAMMSGGASISFVSSDDLDAMRDRAKDDTEQ